ncbi:hypothetical protein DOTSEDRAFT_39358 [Dothistroma septosporum NZE10]|uniref:Uncharacterized protein n=1 Tax=Dothistroma septosporum (strain NZE10 / CBS 128990) TaxID=675120 RepID=N1PBH6_DOTSN|nr:hypothetical protein DOTSEDRAFT_39358 [Dothistroma septosporum NZE10]
MASRNRNPPQEAFPFFQLPGELRNAIYDFLPCRDRVILAPTTDCTYRVWRRDIPKLYLMMVNTNFKTEYRHKASKRSVIRVEDTKEGPATAFHLPPGSEPMRLTCDLTCLVGQHVSDLQAHAKMVESIVQQTKKGPSVQLTIYFDFTPGDNLPSARELINKHQMAVDKLTGVTNLLRLGLYIRQYRDGYTGKRDC